MAAIEFDQVRCVIFDMDGVIIDSEEIHKKAYFETFQSIGVEVSDELYKTFTGSSTINAFQRLVSHFQLDWNPEELVIQKRNRYVDYFENDPNLHLVRGVEELIIHCYNKGYTLILASSSAMVNINRVFSRFDLHKYFSDKISGADLVTSKPDPEIFERAVLLGKTEKKHCLIIEDSDNGIEAANKAGVRVVGYRNPLSENQSLQNADLIIHDFEELRLLI